MFRQLKHVNICSTRDVRVKIGKEKRVYRRYATPWEVFQQLPDPAQYLHPGRTLAALSASALQCSDTEAAHRMQQAKHELFRTFYPEAQRA